MLPCLAATPGWRPPRHVKPVCSVPPACQCLHRWVHASTASGCWRWQRRRATPLGRGAEVGTCCWSVLSMCELGEHACECGNRTPTDRSGIHGDGTHCMHPCPCASSADGLWLMTRQPARAARGVCYVLTDPHYPDALQAASGYPVLWHSHRPVGARCKPATRRDILTYGRYTRW